MVNCTGDFAGIMSFCAQDRSRTNRRAADRTNQGRGQPREDMIGRGESREGEPVGLQPMGEEKRNLARDGRGWLREAKKVALAVSNT